MIGHRIGKIEISNNKLYIIQRTSFRISWSQRDRNQSGRRDYRDNYNSGRMNYSRNDRYSPADRSGDMSPPMKRIRSTGGRDWDERYSNYDSGYHGGGGGSGGHHVVSHYNRDSYGQHDRERDDEYDDDDVIDSRLNNCKIFINNY